MASRKYLPDLIQYSNTQQRPLYMRRHLKYLPYYLLIFLLAFGLKYHYSRANSEQLDWILAPTAGMVKKLSDLPFEREVGEGYINYERALIIAPSCAGVNFMITAFCMAGFSFLRLFKRRRERLRWIFFSLLVSYLLTVFVNAVRILLGMYLYQANVLSAWLNPEQAHRIEGITVYFFFLSSFYHLLQKILTTVKVRNLSKKGCLVKIFPPILWYLCMALLIPFIHQVYQRDIRLSFEHAATVTLLCSIAFAMLRAGKIYWQRWLKVDKV